MPDLQFVEVFHGHLWISIGSLSDDLGVDFGILLAFVYHCLDGIVIQVTRRC